MVFSVLRRATASVELDGRFPLPGEDRQAIAMDPQDGTVCSARVTGVKVTDVTGGRARALADLGETSAVLYVTQARVALATSGPDGPLIGHLRYSWVTTIHARERSRWFSPETLAVGFRDPGGEGFGSLLVNLDHRTPASRVAYEIATLAARHQARSAHGALRSRLLMYAATPTTSRSGRFIRYELPGDDV